MLHSCILYKRLQVWLDGHLCAVHDVADMLSVWLTYVVLSTQVR